jgi:hypothetical protein
LEKEKPNKRSMNRIIEKSLEKKEEERPLEISTTPYFEKESPICEKHLTATIIPVKSATSITKPTMKNFIFDSK